MRSLFPVVGVGAILLSCGCADSKWSIFRHSQESVQLPDTQPPTALALVNYLNGNAVKLQSLKCSEMDLDIKQGLQQFHITGKLACQKPRNFRMQAVSLSKTEADIGSNDSEFWYWIARGDPYLIHCSYRDLANGVRIPFPFQPEWVMEALGMSEYDTTQMQDYQVVNGRTTYELVQNTRNSRGQAVRKVTVFNKLPSAVQVTDHYLTDASGRQEICRAHITEAPRVNGTGGDAVLPRKIDFTYPAEGLTLRMTLWHRADDLVVNGYFDPKQVATLFTRPVLTGVQDYDLARGMTGTSQVRPVGAIQR
jgi:hypothetical protein